MWGNIHIVGVLAALTRVISIGWWGGSPMEDLLETQIDLHRPASFPYWDNLVVRQQNFDTLFYNDSDSGEHKSMHIGNWETYTLRYWYEYRIRHAACPQKPIGIAAATDLSLLCTCLFGQVNVEDDLRKVRTIFVHTYMLSHFYESTLTFMPRDVRFILYTGGTDMTIPTGSGDARFGFPRWFGSHGQGWEAMITDDRIVHWYAENHDMPHPKITTLPTGFTEDVYYKSLPAGKSYPDEASWKPLEERPLYVLSADRVRVGTQWKAREEMEKNCRAASWCVQPADKVFTAHSDKRDSTGLGMPHEVFLKDLRKVPFIACVHGGGIDPSPKAFEAILQGTIPIVRKTLLYDSYHLFPIAWIDEWSDFFNLNDKDRTALLHKWIKELGPYYEKGSALRQKTLERMTTAYWIEDGHKRLAQRIQEEAAKDNKTVDKGHNHHHSGNNRNKKGKKMLRRV